MAGTSGADSPASGAAELTSAGASVGAGEDSTGPATGASVAGPSGSTLETASILGVTAGASVEGGTSGAAEEDDPASGVGASVLGDSADSDSVVTTGASVAGEEEDEDSTGPATGPSVVGTSSPASGVTGASVESGTSEGAEVEEANPASGTDAGASVDTSIGPAEELTPLSDPPSSVDSAGSGVVDSEPDEVDPLSPVVGTDGAFVGGLISMVGTPDPVGGCVWMSTGVSVVITSGSSVEISPPLGPALLLLDSDTWEPEEIADDSVVAAGATASFVSETGGITSGDSVSLTRAGGASVASVPVVPEVSPDGAADDGSTGCDSVVAGGSVAAGRRASFDSEITSGNSVDDDGKTVVVGGSVAGSSVDDDGDAEEELSLLVSGVTIASASSVVTEGSGVVATSDGDSVSVVSESTDSLSSPDPSPPAPFVNGSSGFCVTGAPDPSPPVDMSVTCSSGFCVGSTGATGVADVVAGSSSWSSHSKTGQHLLGMKTGLQLGM